jgi:NAD(P)H-hydrate epimerase
MKARTGTEMRELDRKAIEYCGIPGIFLMEQAGKAAAFYAEQLAKPFSFPDFTLLAGKGNNGGVAEVYWRIRSNPAQV